MAGGPEGAGRFAGVASESPPASRTTVNLLLIDNYDSFSFNLVQALGELGARVEVVRHDRVTVDECLARRPRALLVSPGPGRPEQAGISVAAVRACAREGIPLLGVCLGMQALAAAFAGRVVRAPAVMHGKTSWIRHDGRGLFRDLPSPFQATRYHSLVVDEASCAATLEVSARAGRGEVMGLRHRNLPLHGVQFHPESILTREGPRLLRNFLELCVAETCA